MKLNKLVLLFVVCSAQALEYKPLALHASALYNLVDAYVDKHSTELANNVFLYVNSAATQPVYVDARASGYDRATVNFAAYQLAYVSTPRVDVIVEGMHDVVEGDNKLKDATFYSTWTVTGVSTILTGCWIRDIYRYFKRHNPFRRA